MVSKSFLRDVWLFGSGIIISFLLQIFYDALQKDKPYSDWMQPMFWRGFLALTCLVAWVLMTLSIRSAGALRD